jgi:NACHT domain
MRVVELCRDAISGAYIQQPSSIGSDSLGFEHFSENVEALCELKTVPVKIDGTISDRLVYVARDNVDIAFLVRDDSAAGADKSTGLETIRESLSDEIDQYLQKYINTETSFDDFKVPVWPHPLDLPIYEIDTILQQGSNVRETHALRRGALPRRSILVGRAGSGKTTFVRRLAFEIASANARGDTELSVPVIIQLRHLDDPVIDSAFITNYMERDGFSKLSHFYASPKRAMRFVLLFDGLDEVNVKIRDDVEQSILAFQPSGNDSILLTSRREAVRRPFDGYSKYETGELTDYLVRRWCYEFVGDRRNWKRFHASIHSNLETSAAFRNPLWLTWAAHLFTRFSLFPNQSTDVYENIVRALADDWDSRRGVTRSVGIWESPRQKIALLSFIAHRLEISQTTIATEETVDYWISERLGNNIAEACRTLASETGLLKEQPSKVWSFVHRSVQEYLAAHFAIESSRDVFSIAGEVPSYLELNKLSLMSRMTSDPSYFIERLLSSSSVNRQEKGDILLKVFSEDIQVDSATKNNSYNVIGDYLKNITQELSEVHRAKDGGHYLKLKNSDSATLERVKGAVFRLSMLKGTKYRSEIGAVASAVLNSSTAAFVTFLLSQYIVRIAQKVLDGAEVLEVSDMDDKFDTD